MKYNNFKEYIQSILQNPEYGFKLKFYDVKGNLTLKLNDIKYIFILNHTILFELPDNKSNILNIWKNATEIYETDTPVEDKYCIELKGKMRYIVPLVKQDNKYIRINELSDNAKQDIERCLNFKTKKYAYLDFNF